MSNKKIFFNFFLLVILTVYSSALDVDIDRLLDFFKSFVQKNISNKTLLQFLKTFRNLVPAKEYPGNLEQNTQNFPNHFYAINENRGYIEDQRNYEDMKYGLTTIAFSGCEIIAVYNALYDLTGEKNRDFPGLIDYFEKNGILLYGYLGTEPLAIEEYLIKLGFETMSSTEKEDYPNIQDKCDVFILIKYNNKNDITKMIHTISISKRNGKFYLHNSGFSGHLDEYESIMEILSKINNGNAQEIYLIGIKKK